MAEPVLQIEALEKSFGALKATDGVTLDLRAGEIHALIGPNGAGKSTLIGQIAGAIRPDRGRIVLMGRDLAGVDAAGRAHLGLARTFQVSAVCAEFSVLQNVMLAVAGVSGRAFGLFRPALKDRRLVAPAEAAIERAGLQGRARIAAGDLSHGERRKLEIAMALAVRPRVFLMDEPMAGMGPDGAKEMTVLLAGLKTEAPILLVEHDMEAVFALADRVSVLVYGRIIASGTVAEVRADPQVQSVYLGETA